ncbi:MAG: tetratricopeptide repeat protein [Myxococcota bacterium]
MNETNWIPGLVVLLAGLVAGVVFVLLARRSKPTAASDGDATLADLDERYRMLLGQLKELSAERHHLGEERYALERTRLELAAAAALKEKDHHLRGVRHQQAKAAARAEKRERAQPDEPQGFFAKNPAFKGALWGGGVVLFFVLLGVLLGQESKTRVDEMPSSMKPPSEAPQEDLRFQGALERLNSAPDDLGTLAEVSHELIRRQQFDEAQRLNERAAGLDPFHLETRIHRAVLRAVQGEGGRAMAELEHLAVTYPDAHEALLFAGALAMQLGDKERALTHLERFLVEAPPGEQPPMLANSVAQLRAELRK